MNRRTVAKGIFVYKAQAVIRPVPDMVITARQSVPESGSSSKDLANDAKKIVDALTASLPGGTLDRVRVLLMMSGASELLVRYQDGGYRSSGKKGRTKRKAS